VTLAVLVVEDEPLARAFAADVLEEAGFAVIEAPSADYALIVLDKGSDVAVVFTDIEMPGNHNGLDLARFISDRYPKASIIIASGRVRPRPEDIPSKALFLSKPYGPEALADAFEKLVPTHRHETSSYPGDARSTNLLRAA
jgi:CheY-like chemotaxis protein